MKLERLFEVKDSKLYRIGGDEVSLCPEMIYKINWSEVEGNPEEYNEDFLAKLRDELKKFEDENKFVFIEGAFDKDCDFEQYTQAMKHTARRIKDCVSVIGFVIPEKFSAEAQNFIEELSAKHQQYCFSCGKAVDGCVVFSS